MKSEPRSPILNHNSSMPFFPPGYKQTEVGIIPEEWEVKQMGELATFLSGGTPSRSNDDYWTGDIPWISATSLRCFYIYRSDSNVTKEAVAAGSKMAPIGSTLLLVRGSALHKEILSGLVTKSVCFNQDVKALVPNSQIAPKFLTFVLLGKAHELLKLVSSAGNTAGVLDTKLLKAFGILLPPLPEQRAIAEALSDVDGLLGGLDRLIAKKRDLKQATMQQLLTGQTRLPGFHGEWAIKKLGDLGATYGGLTGKTKADFCEGSANYVTFLNVMMNVVIDCGAFERVKVAPTESQNRVAKGDLLFNGSSETPEEVAMCAVMMHEVPDLFLNSFCFGFRFREGAEADGLFLAYYFRSKEGRELMKSLAQGSTRYNLSKGALLKSQVRLPLPAEQTAIVEVLTEMDVELAALEQRREKTRALKQAMMQELLTGRIRLV